MGKAILKLQLRAESANREVKPLEKPAEFIRVEDAEELSLRSFRAQKQSALYQTLRGKN